MEKKEPTRKPGRPPGQPKTGGRKKGTPNKVTSEIKDWVTSLVWRERRQLEDDLKKLEPKDRLAFMERLLSYVIPKQGSTHTTIDINKLPEEAIDEIITELTKDL